MTFFVLASVVAAQPPPDADYESRRLWLESWDGAQVMPVPLDDLPHELIGQRGMLGLGVAPTDLATQGTPGVAGSRVVDVIERDRPVALPLAFIADRQADLWDTLQRLRDLTDPTNTMTEDGNFRLCCASGSGTRQLSLAYRSGLEGEDTERHGTDVVVIDAVAPQPYAEDRFDQTKTFRLGTTLMPFLAAAGTDYPWGTRQLSPSSVADADTPFEMFSAVPVFPVFELTGPADSVLITAGNGLRIDVPDGIADGSTLRIVTDPRHKTIRLDGALAAGMLARGSRFVPFPLGVTLVDVDAPGASADTLLRLTWRGLHRGLW